MNRYASPWPTWPAAPLTDDAAADWIDVPQPATAAERPRVLGGPEGGS
jgi:hypothetical protein